MPTSDYEPALEEIKLAREQLANIIRRSRAGKGSVAALNAEDARRADDALKRAEERLGKQ